MQLLAQYLTRTKPGEVLLQDSFTHSWRCIVPGQSLWTSAEDYLLLMVTLLLTDSPGWFILSLYPSCPPQKQCSWGCPMCFACMVLQVIRCLILDPHLCQCFGRYFFFSAWSQGQTLFHLPFPYQWPEPNGLTRSWKWAYAAFSLRVQPPVANTPSGFSTLAMLW